MRRLHRRVTRCRGLTLLELAITLVLVGVLLSIGVPSFQAYVDMAHSRSMEAFFAQKRMRPGSVDSTLPDGVSSHAHFVRATPADRAYAKLPSAYTYVGAPIRMNLEETRHVYLALSMLKVADPLHLFLDESLIDAKQIKASDRMQVQLESGDFDITAEAPTVQAVRSQSVTQCSWDIRARRSGRCSLSLVVSALVRVSGSDTPLILTTYRRVVDVAVTPGQRIWSFLQENADWMWAPVAALFTWIGIVAGWRRHRRKT